MGGTLRRLMRSSYITKITVVIGNNACEVAKIAFDCKPYGRRRIPAIYTLYSIPL